MQQSDFDNFSGMLGAIGELYARGAVSDYAIGLWWNALAQYDLAAVRQAFDRHVKNPDNGQFMPKPADVIRMIAGTTQDSALVAWSKVDKAIRHVGTYESVVFDDPLIHCVMHEMGGWVLIGTKGDKEWPFVGKEFETRYRGYKMRNEQPDYPPIMIGISEAQNSTQGLGTQQPLLLGDPAKAMLVARGGIGAPMLAMRAAKFLPTSLPPPAPATGA